jgi:hypothetical protein
MQTLRQIWRAFRLLFDVALTGAADLTAAITGVRQQNRTELEIYLAGLRRLAIIIVFAPIPILAFGVIGNLGWLVGFIGIFWASISVVLLLLTAPIGLILETLILAVRGGFTRAGIGERYVRVVLGILLFELSMTLFIGLVPIRNNLAALPLFVVAALVLAILGLAGTKTAFTRKFIAAVATIAVIFFTFSFFFPQSSASMIAVRGKFDKELAEAVNSSGLGDPKDISSDEDYAFPPGVFLIEVPLEPDVWSPWVKTPAESPKCWIYPPEGGCVWILYLDGSRKKLCDGEPKHFGTHRAIFRLRGNGVAKVKIVIPDYFLEAETKSGKEEAGKGVVEGDSLDLLLGPDDDVVIF